MTKPDNQRLVEKVEKLKALHAESTQGEWNVEQDIFGNGGVDRSIYVGEAPSLKNNWKIPEIIADATRTKGECDLDFCAEAHNSLPEIAESYLTLAKKVERYEKALEGMLDQSKTKDQTTREEMGNVTVTKEYLEHLLPH